MSLNSLLYRGKDKEYVEMNLAIDTANRKIKISGINNRAVDNDILKEVYPPRLVDLWYTDSDCIKYHFPMTYITINHITSIDYFSFINGWSLEE